MLSSSFIWLSAALTLGFSCQRRSLSTLTTSRCILVSLLLNAYMVARFMARRSALVGRSRIHSANARMMMEATITPMDPQKHGMKSGFAWSVQNQAISARINARPAARAASLWNTRASVRMGCVTSPTASATR